MITSNPYTLRRVRIARISVLGRLWMPQCLASMEIALTDHDLHHIEEFTRENVEDWLTCHSGDFSSVIDFAATCGETEIPWSSEENECLYLDTFASPDDDDDSEPEETEESDDDDSDDDDSDCE